MDIFVRFWLFLCHWVKFDCFDDQTAAEETAQHLSDLHLPVKLRYHTDKKGAKQYVLYVKDADRDLARHYTGWRISL